jgi:hypothetical protein
MGKKVLPNLDITEEDYSAAEKNKLRGAQYADVLDWMTRYQLTQPR